MNNGTADVGTSTARAPQPMREFGSIRDRLLRFGLIVPDREISRPALLKMLIGSAAIFFVAVGVRILHWQDEHVTILSAKTSLAGVYERYHKEAERMIAERAILFPSEPPVDGDARILVHPPGYSMIIAAVLRFTGEPEPALWFIQVAADSIAAVLVLLIAAEFFPWATALIAGLLVALSPHLAHYSLVLSPDSLPVLPVIGAVYVIVLALRRPRLGHFLIAGALIGISCWLRANALALAPFIAALVLALFWRVHSWRYGLALLGATVLVVSPITIRNAIVFKRFIPISIAAGLNLSEGIGNYDPPGSLGMPRSDREARFKDVEWSGRQDYARSLWTPDGIERDQVRWNRGVEVIRAHPSWFFGVMLRRAAFMLRSNDAQAHEFPFNTAIVPFIASERGFSHPVAFTGTAEISWRGQPTVLTFGGAIIPQSVAIKPGSDASASLSPGELLSSGSLLSDQPATASAALNGDRAVCQIAGDDSAFGDQFASAPIPVEKGSDYVLVLPARLVRGDVAVKVTSEDRRVALALISLAAVQNELHSNNDESAAPSAGAPPFAAIQLPFATGNRDQVRIVISNNSTARPVSQIGESELFNLGTTPSTWTRYPRRLLRGAQRNLFITGRMLPLVSLGLVLLLFARQYRSVALLTIVPLYYLSAQSVLSTEYRYIIGIHYFLFVVAAIPLAVALRCLWLGGCGLWRRAAGQKTA